LELAGVTEFKLNPGGTAALPVNVFEAVADLKAMPLSINLATNGVVRGLATPQNAPIKEGLPKSRSRFQPSCRSGHPATLTRRLREPIFESECRGRVLQRSKWSPSRGNDLRFSSRGSLASAKLATTIPRSEIG